MLVETFPKADQSFLKATLVMWIPFVVRFHLAGQPALSKKIPFVVSPSNHERNQGTTHSYLDPPLRMSGT